MLGELQPHVNQRFSIKCRQNHPKKANIAQNRLKNTLKVGLCAVTAPHVMKNTWDNTLTYSQLEVLTKLKSIPNEVHPALGILHVGQFQLGKITKWKNYKMVRYQFGNFTMGVNNKKVNRYGEFVTERVDLVKLYFEQYKENTALHQNAKKQWQDFPQDAKLPRIQQRWVGNRF